MEAALHLMVSSKLTFLLGYEPFGMQLEAHRPKKNKKINIKVKFETKNFHSQYMYDVREEHVLYCQWISAMHIISLFFIDKKNR